jgi:hypothetical protein
MAGAFGIGKVPDLARAESEKQLLVNLAGRRQRARGVAIQPEEDAGLWDADRIGPIEVRRDPVVGIGQLLGERHQGHLSGSVRSNRIEKLRPGQPGIDETLGQAREIGTRPLPTLIADVDEEGAVPTAMMAVAHLMPIFYSPIY